MFSGDPYGVKAYSEIAAEAPAPPGSGGGPLVHGGELVHGGALIKGRLVAAFVLLLAVLK